MRSEIIMERSAVRALLVDDESAFLDLSKHFLEREGKISAVTVISAAEALEHVKLEQYDVIVSDYQMPDKDGIQLLKDVRAAGSTIPFILFTGKGREQVVIDALNAGADYYLQKGGDVKAQFAELQNMIVRSVQRHRLEQALIENEERYRSLLDQAADGMILHDETGRIIDVNKRACQNLGFSREEMLSKSIGDIDPDAILEGKDKLWNAVLKGKSFTFESRQRRKDGSSIPVEVTLGAVHMSSGTAVLGVTRDISERKRAEMELSARNRIADVLLNIADEEMYGHVLGIVLDVMGSKLGVFGYLEENGDWVVPTMTRMVWDKCQVPDKKYVFPRETWGDSTWPTAIREKRTIVMNERSTRIPDGHIGISRHISMPLIHQDEVVGLIQVANKDSNYTGEDIELLESIGRTIAPVLEARLKTERQEDRRLKAEIALADVNKKLTILSGITRHDINNQLTILAANLALLDETQIEPPSGHFLLEAESAAKRISAIIEFTEAYEEIGVRAPIWQDVHALVERCARDVQLGHVRVVNEIPAGIELFADSLVARVFTNLMDNAVRHGGKIKTIRFSFDEHDGVRTIECEDDGVGIPADTKAKLFTRGFGKNHGLGLFLSREILSATGIALTEEGEPGRGARFVMTLPSEVLRAARGAR